MQNQPRKHSPPPRRLVHIKKVESLNPSFIRLTFAGESLLDFRSEGPAERVRIFFPFPKQQHPSDSADGANRSDDVIIESRAYTVRKWDAAKKELTVDFYVHGNGTCSRWVAQAEVGDELEVAGPRGAYHPDDQADWYLLVGDETAMPGIATILEALSEHATAFVYIAVLNEQEELPLTSSANLRLTWIHRDRDASKGYDSLIEAVKQAELPEGRGAIWVACEADVMRAIRRHLLDDRKLDPSSLHTRGYWKRNVANHPDHDTGEDNEEEH